ncbi:MAG: hypothetical protein ABI625_09865 [bacterium]
MTKGDSQGPAHVERTNHLEYPIRVLFLCTGNSARSQIAEAPLTRKGGDRFLVASAGTDPAPTVREEAVAALKTLGIDWADARPKGIDHIVDRKWDMVITLCERPRESCANLPSWPVTAHWGGISGPEHGAAQCVRRHRRAAVLAHRPDARPAARAPGKAGARGPTT